MYSTISPRYEAFLFCNNYFTLLIGKCFVHLFQAKAIRLLLNCENMNLEIFVVGYGKDCDGFNSGNVTAFKSLDIANSACFSMNESSDGIRFKLVGKKEALNYCNGFEIDLPEFSCDEIYSN